MNDGWREQERARRREQTRRQAQARAAVKRDARQSWQQRLAAQLDADINRGRADDLFGWLEQQTREACEARGGHGDGHDARFTAVSVAALLLERVFERVRDDCGKDFEAALRAQLRSRAAAAKKRWR